MIVFNLACDGDHRFEGWFASAEAFDDQRARGLVACPVCGSDTVERLPSAPYVVTRHEQRPVEAAKPTPAPAPAPTVEAAAVMALLRRMARESEDVGERFPDEARKIHYGDAEARSIRGQAGRDDLEELIEEGIMVLPVPGEEDLH
ncbi:DUF1178 family protein [Pseudothauera rhizosphaerae]|uniref:DUF1178 family protein n=1 Tax=Pseudothauera rhizosphaerae TaxID=2565932 RepID=A0A4S4AUB0_9RHOO|nr:DUF1178 family protein [Pseudothauera rhizosphaerae]THF63354.1 DUF1178 family protein [Pseudothauera rhizosphaerae]